VATPFVARLNSALTVLGQATYYGGRLVQSGLVGAGQVNALALDAATGAIFVAGSVDTFFFPCSLHAFVKRLDTSLAVAGSITFSSPDFGARASANALAIHPDTGDVYAAGAADAKSIPGTLGGAQAGCTGLCAFIVRLNSSLTSLIQATFLGDDESAFRGASALAIHPTTGDVYVAGTTSDPSFPGTTGGLQAVFSGDQDAFIARLTSSLAALFQATYLGDIGLDVASGLTIHPTTGDVYLTGSTSPLIFPSNFPGTTGGAQPSSGGGTDAFIARMTPTLALVDPPAGPDLTITKAHLGDFARNHAGAVYMMVVSNVGTAATVGTVTVTDTLPAGLTATALAGTGWSCTLGTLTCTRSDVLGNGDSYPPITLTVTVASTAPSSVINTATVSGGGDVNPGNDSASDPTAVVSFFLDVSPLNPFAPWIDALFASGITGGCNTDPPLYCPDSPVTRGEMAVFLLRGIHGASYTPPAATGLFVDVPPDNPFAPWIEQLYVEGITTGCNTSPLLYCFFANVTRAQMAVFLLRARHGAAYQPPAATGIFADVPIADPFAPWIEQLFAEGITGGCGTSPLRYCPNDDVTREQMAVFLVRDFGLPFP
jgi:hypothetical protein